jgi:hypothetical protein
MPRVNVTLSQPVNHSAVLPASVGARSLLTPFCPTLSALLAEAKQAAAILFYNAPTTTVITAARVFDSTWVPSTRTTLFFIVATLSRCTRSPAAACVPTQLIRSSRSLRSVFPTRWATLCALSTVRRGTCECTQEFHGLGTDVCHRLSCSERGPVELNLVTSSDVRLKTIELSGAAVCFCAY